MKRYLPILLALLLAACQREAGPDALKLTGKMFVFNYRLAYATYLLTLEQTQPLPEGSVVKAEFENPAGGPALVLERKIFPSLPRVVLESPDITCGAPRPFGEAYDWNAKEKGGCEVPVPCCKGA